MASADDDIRADFLAEAGELVERLGGQLVELESRPQDADLLNAIFRAFHTVKGGAGFLNLTALVELCHVAEDVFNALRNRRRALDATLLDAVLQALDQVNDMMARVGAGQDLEPAPPSLIATLKQLAKAAPVAAPAPTPAPTPAPMVAAPVAATPVAPADPDTITEDEFEALLDQLQGKKAAPAPAVAAEVAAAPMVEAPVAVVEPLPVMEPVAVPARAPVASTPPPAETSVRVDTQKLDALMNLVGELVLARNRLKSLRSTALGEPVSRAISELDFITRGLQNAVMQIRMQPIKKVFSRFPKLARDVARGLGKQVEVTLHGEDTDLDKNLVEALADPLVHMVRNSVDHGIEMPEERTRRGKPAAGQLSLSASQEGDHILIVVRDDGAGMDAERIRGKVVEKGLMSAADAGRLTPEECLQLVCLPGFSTKDQVSDLSGRGVGMDVVMSRIKSLNGSVHIESKPGQGSAIRIRVPLTLAILPALMVQVDTRIHALPLAAVSDVFQLDPARIEKLDRWDVVLTRRETLRLVYLDPWLQAPAEPGPRHVVVATVGDERYGFVVREVRGREEIVIKPLGASLRALSAISGATVLPDGRVALILDFPGLVAAFQSSLGLASNPLTGVARG